MKSSHSIVLNTDFEQALKNVNYWLTNEGFNIIEPIDLNELAGDSVKSAPKCHRILCDYNPDYLKGLQEYDNGQIDEPQFCNVIVRELEESEVEISFIDPEISSNPYQFKRQKKMILKVKKSLLKAISNIKK